MDEGADLHVRQTRFVQYANKGDYATWPHYVREILDAISRPHLIDADAAHVMGASALMKKRLWWFTTIQRVLKEVGRLSGPRKKTVVNQPL